MVISICRDYLNFVEEIVETVMKNLGLMHLSSIDENVVELVKPCKINARSLNVKSGDVHMTWGVGLIQHSLILLKMIDVKLY